MKKAGQVSRAVPLAVLLLASSIAAAVGNQQALDSSSSSRLGLQQQPQPHQPSSSAAGPALDASAGLGGGHRRLLQRSSSTSSSRNSTSNDDEAEVKGGNCPDNDDVLELHNDLRETHGAGELTWNSTLASRAQAFAEELASNQCGGQQQGGPSSSHIAFNTFALRTSGGSLRNTSCKTAAGLWAAEAQSYNWDAPAKENWNNIHKIGHFTLMAWEDTRSLGCGQAKCDDSSYVAVCGYYPAGNLLLTTVWDGNLNPPEDDSTDDDDSSDDNHDPGDQDEDDDSDDDDSDDNDSDDDDSDDDSERVDNGGQADADEPTAESQDMRSSKCPDPRATLESHNKYRALHGSPKLVWNASLVESAQRWSDVLQKEGCNKLRHSYYEGLGENLYTKWVEGGTLDSTNCIDAVQPWYDEIKLYDYSNPEQYWEDDEKFRAIGHFTAMVWKSTTNVGCTMSQCGDTAYVVNCQYYPQGNIIGNRELWDANVPRPLDSNDAKSSADNPTSKLE